MIENEGGFVVEVKDVNQAIKALELKGNPYTCKSQSKFNILKVKKFYTESIVINQYIEAYEILLKKIRRDIRV